MTEQDATASATTAESDPAEHKMPPRAGIYIARGDRIFRLKRYVVVALVLGFGLWSAWDGFIAWPEEAANYERITRQMELVPQGGAEYVRLAQEQKQYTDHSATDILFNRVMALVLPPLALLLLARWLYISRGAIRLDEFDTLYAPGHPPVGVSAIRGLNDELWQRKGISLVTYELPGGTSGSIRLDHDWYEPRAIHAIHDRLAYLLNQRAAAGTGLTSGGPSRSI